MNFVQQCIVCKKQENLTPMTIKITDVDHHFFICEEHAEECSLKNLKEIINGKIESFKALKQQMIDLGIDFTKKEKPQIKPTPPPGRIVREGSKPPPLNKAPVVQRQIRTTGSAEAQTYQSHDIDSAVEKEAQLMSERTGREVTVAKTVEREEQEAKGVCGTNMIIPKRLKSSDGSVTNISIVKTSNSDIMKRIDPENGIAPPRDCSLCRGTGQVNKGQQCPKCRGAGVL